MQNGLDDGQPRDLTPSPPEQPLPGSWRSRHQDPRVPHKVIHSLPHGPPNSPLLRTRPKSSIGTTHLDMSRFSSYRPIMCRQIQVEFPPPYCSFPWSPLCVEQLSSKCCKATFVDFFMDCPDILTIVNMVQLPEVGPGIEVIPFARLPLAQGNITYLT